MAVGTRLLLRWRLVHIVFLDPRCPGHCPCIVVGITRQVYKEPYATLSSRCQHPTPRPTLRFKQDTEPLISYPLS